MFDNQKLINDIYKLRNNIDKSKYNELESDLKDYGNLLYEDFNQVWENEVIHKELLKYKKDLEKIQKLNTKKTKLYI